jgi:hypothetical protein
MANAGVSITGQKLGHHGLIHRARATNRDNAVTRHVHFAATIESMTDRL